ncbi:unnamed protein product [Schistocephalus solidus]|uniref:Phosphomannomutase n=1 Tax=Schistocephalus solidus TaxID=70667 RepID=A0A183TJU0_SCHSO|nr:unnamed protein product [Schistocephalus solidus]
MHKITADMYECLMRLQEKVNVGVVGGSDLNKISEQMGGANALHKIKHVFSENGLVAFREGELISRMDITVELGEELLQKLINFILRYLSEIKLPLKRGTFVEFRKGMLNVSPVGRSCSQAEREAFFEYDKVHKIREKMVDTLKKEFANDNLEFSIGKMCFLTPQLPFTGGQISIDIFPTGWNKCFCLQFLTDYNTIHFFGDKTMPVSFKHSLSAVSSRCTNEVLTFFLPPSFAVDRAEISMQVSRNELTLPI